jgi:hypothetical protein
VITTFTLVDSVRRHSLWRRNFSFVSPLIGKEFPIDPKVHPDFRRIRTNMQGCGFIDHLSIGFCHSVLLQ